MKIDKAIEILELECTSHKLKSDPDYLAAAKLGKEALKAIKCGREGLRTEFHTPLIGETE